MPVDVAALNEIHRVETDTVEHRIMRPGGPSLWVRRTPLSIYRKKANKT